MEAIAGGLGRTLIGVIGVIRVTVGADGDVAVAGEEILIRSRWIRDGQGGVVAPVVGRQVRPEAGGEILGIRPGLFTLSFLLVVLVTDLGHF
jgi:hypothetical protein